MRWAHPDSVWQPPNSGTQHARWSGWCETGPKSHHRSTSSTLTALRGGTCSGSFGGRTLDYQSSGCPRSSCCLYPGSPPLFRKRKIQENRLPAWPRHSPRSHTIQRAPVGLLLPWNPRDQAHPPVGTDPREEPRQLVPSGYSAPSRAGSFECDVHRVATPGPPPGTVERGLHPPRVALFSLPS